MRTAALARRATRLEQAVASATAPSTARRTATTPPARDAQRVIFATASGTPSRVVG
jgi:hypothetical protein